MKKVFLKNHTSDGETPQEGNWVHCQQSLQHPPGMVIIPARKRDSFLPYNGAWGIKSSKLVSVKCVGSVLHGPAVANF